MRKQGQKASKNKTQIKHQPILPHPVYRRLHFRVCPGYPRVSRHVPQLVLKVGTMSKRECWCSDWSFVMKQPFRRNIRVADAWERIWPPMGFKAPPATNVIVAPGSAIAESDPTLIPTSNSLLTLHLVRKEYRDLRFAQIRITACKSSWIKPTLNSSESLDNLESIYEPIRTLTTAFSPTRRYLGKLSDCQGTAGHQDERLRDTFCCLSLSSPRPE